MDKQTGRLIHCHVVWGDFDNGDGVRGDRGFVTVDEMSNLNALIKWRSWSGIWHLFDSETACEERMEIVFSCPGWKFLLKQAGKVSFLCQFCVLFEKCGKGEQTRTAEKMSMMLQL